MDYLSSALENLISAEMGSRSHTELARDPQFAGWLRVFDKSAGVEIHWGQVVDCLPFLNAYRVCAGPRSYLWCSDSSIGGYQPFGAKSTNTIPIGALVFYITPPQTPWWGVIVAVQPAPLLSHKHFRADYVWPGSRAGYRVEQAHKFSVESMAQSAGAVDWSAGRPLDATSLGEWGATTETGLAFHLDPFLAYMRVSEDTGLSLFLHDALARLAGHNLQIRSAVGEREDLDDEGEISRLDGHALHYLEALGWLRPGATLTTSNSAEDTQGSKAHLGTLEPAHDTQQPFYRLQETRGYLGQGFRRTLCLPPQNVSTINRYQDAQVYPGVFEESLAASGAYAVRSAKRVIIAKKPAIPIPKMMRRPEDDTGDKRTNYNASGGLNDQTPHLVADSPAVEKHVEAATITAISGLATTVSAAASRSAAVSAITGVANSIRTDYPEAAGKLDQYAGAIDRYPVDPLPQFAEFAAAITVLAGTLVAGGPLDEPGPNLIRAATILDLGAFDFNWGATLHPYVYHNLDWYVPESDELPIGKDWEIPTFGELASAQYLAGPAAVLMDVDHRVGKARYFPNESMIALLDDGGIVIGDGYGAEIRMVGGSIMINAPGDIWLQAGKNVNCWSGWDFIAKARNSADITASRKDVRIKAEHNCMIMAGNDGCGGVLIESRAQGPSYDYEDKIGEDVTTTGIVLKASKSQVVSWGKEVVLLGAEEGDATKGQVILDANDRVKTYCKYMDRTFKDGGALDIFLNSGGSVVAVNEYWATAATFGTDVRIAGRAQVSQCLWVNGNITVSDGHIATSQAAAYRHQVALLAGANLTAAQSMTSATNTRSSTLISTIGPAELDTSWRTAVQTAVFEATFSLRNAAQYQTESFMLVEGRWQQVARLASEALPTWTEPVVTVGSEETLPHPGKDAWEGETYFTADLSLYSGGNNVDRGPDYEVPVTPPTAKTVLKDTYPIIINADYCDPPS